MGIVIFGTNDFAQLANFYLRHDPEGVKYLDTGYQHNQFHPRYLASKKPVAFTVNRLFRTQDTFETLPIVDFESLSETHPPDKYLLFAPLADNALRAQAFDEGKKRGYDFISYVNSRIDTFNSVIGANCMILENNTIQPFTRIGNNVIFWSGNHLGHHSTVESNIFVASQAVISGHCHLKEGAWLGVNCCIREGVTIENNCIIGMGSVVTKHTEKSLTYVGNPAKPLHYGKV